MVFTSINIARNNCREISPVDLIALFEKSPLCSNFMSDAGLHEPSKDRMKLKSRTLAARLNTDSLKRTRQCSRELARSLKMLSCQTPTDRRRVKLG